MTTRVSGGLGRLHRPRGQNGKQFLYLDQSAILIGWVMERATGKDLSQLLTEDLWAKLGAEQDAYMLLDHYQQAYSSAGFNATLRDVGRFGQMMAQGGRYNGQQIVPESWVNDIRTNGAAGGLGLGGQLLIVDPIVGMVVVKFDSVPTAQSDDNTFQTQYQAIDAIIQAVSGHGCS
jgi:CubicO group peptidase (beta-lactamase class C family)